MNRPEPTTLIALDIDGTISHKGGPVPQNTIDAAAEARADGHHIVLATGRSLVGALPIAKSLGLTRGWLVASNGAVTVRLHPGEPGGYEVTDWRVFDADPVVRLARVLSPRVLIAVEEVGWGWRVNARFEDGRLNGEQRTVTSADELWTTPVSRIALAAPGITNLADRFRALGVTVTRDGLGWVDVTARGLSKASALEAIRETLDVPPAQTVAVGDGWNDVEMLQWAHRSVAMGNALPGVKEAANEVTGTVLEHGAADVLRSLVSKPPQRTTVLA